MSLPPGERPEPEDADVPGDDLPVTRTALAYAQIRRDILSNAFEPGSRITIQFLQRRYDIGPTPLREALARLAAVGFVIGEDNRGFRVPRMSLTALRDITDQRKLVEAQGLKLSIERGERAFRSDLKETFRQLEVFNQARSKDDLNGFLAWEALHRRFHAALISGSGSEWLIRFQSILFDQADRYRRTYSSCRMKPDIEQDHRRIMEAALDADAPMAVLLLERHIERVYATAEASGRLPDV
ncbi:GntR family transcriptional regulator [Amorphus orientalis]|uniref:DNA-binding GntR family transcriptional regulator n=1 Tax=Amorphus orientalis TaxID=649198 RepID=A0AAE3VTC5_9HYPH|nr:FCD domain-containing protein [Amorphus orientalis]MDQ0317798.1 DNA-binding GntR family transcriptional regulator [Amorphus orientalis]